MILHLRSEAATQALWSQVAYVWGANHPHAGIHHESSLLCPDLNELLPAAGGEASGANDAAGEGTFSFIE
jgi:hypothetical protein